MAKQLEQSMLPLGRQYVGSQRRATAKRKMVTWCLIQSKLDNFRHYFEQGQEGLYWYDYTPLRILELFGGNVARTHLYLKLLAATSPLENIASNVRLALKALKLAERGADLASIGRVFRFDAHYCNVVRAIQGQELHGPKVSAFYMNLMGPRPYWKYGTTEVEAPEHFPNAASVVTVDRWMMRVAKGICRESGDKADDAPSLPEYACISRAVQKLAGESGVDPRQYQAAVWVGVKKECGSPEDRADPFEVALQQLMSTGQNEFDFDAPEPELTLEESDPLGGMESDSSDIYGEAEEERMAAGNPPLTREEINARVLGEA